jgi:WD40 repeat protein
MVDFPSAKGYEVQELIGSGGFADVYRAFQPIVNREVALKFIKPIYANQPEFIRNFELEAQFVARLEHPHIVPLFDYWRDSNGAYLVMRLMRGGSLKQRMAKAAFSSDELGTILHQLTSALAFAHRMGVVHRDLKPDNVLLDTEGNIYLNDFGIARLVGREMSQSSISGTLDYVAPEQLMSAVPSPSMDIYSLGVMIYEMLAGKHPFADHSTSELIMKHLNDPLPNLLKVRPDLPPALNDLIQKATAKDPRDRYPTVQAVWSAWQAIYSPQPVADFDDSTLVNPYKGLRAFDEADAADFFGRETLVETLVERVMKERFLAIVGASGSGKSSVVRAGLIPVLRRKVVIDLSDSFVAVMVPGEEPLVALMEALQQVAVQTSPKILEQLQANAHALDWLVDTLIPGNLILVIDQFEELFTLTRDENQRKHFLQLIEQAVTASDSHLRVVITLRADFMNQALRYPMFGELLRDHLELVLPLTPADLERAISGPAERVGLRVDNNLIAAMVADLQSEPGALPLLQYALTEVFGRREGRYLTLNAYRAGGGVTAALAQRAEEVFTGLNENDQKLAQQMFLRLITLGEGVEDTRRRVRQSELATMGNVQPVLAVFSCYSLLVLDRDLMTREPMVEVAHEALLQAWKRLRDWLVESRSDIRLERQLGVLAQEWEQSRYEPSFLLVGVRLAQFRQWMENTTLSLTPLEREYFLASDQQNQWQMAEAAERKNRELALERRAKQVLRWFTAVSVLAAVVAIGLSLFAFSREQQAQIDRDRAQREADVNHSLVLASAVKDIGAWARDLGLALALEAVDLSDPPEESIQALRTAALGGGARSELQAHQNGVKSVNFSPDGRYLISASCANLDANQVCHDGELALWDVETAAELARFGGAATGGHTDWINQAVFSPDGVLIASASADSTVLLWDVATHTVVQRLTGHTGSVNAIVFSPDGKTLVSGGDDHTLRVWDVATGEMIRRLEGHTDAITCLDFQADGKVIASGSLDHMVRLWDAATGEVVQTIDVGSKLVDVKFGPATDSSTPNLFTATLLTIKLWDVTTGQAIGENNGYTVIGVSISPDGQSAVKIDGGGIGFVSRELDQNVSWEPILSELTEGVVWSGAVHWGQRFAAMGASNGIIRILTLGDTGKVRQLMSGMNSGNHMAISHNGRYLVTGTVANGAMLWDATTGELLHQLDYQGDGIYMADADFSPDDRTVLISQGDFMGDGAVNHLVLWDVETGTPIREYSGYQYRVASARFSPDGKTFFAASITWGIAEGAGDLHQWDVATGDVLREFDSTDHLGYLAVSADGQSLLTVPFVSSTPYITLWDTATGQPVRQFEYQSSTNPGFAYSAFGPDEQTVLATAVDGSVLEWDIHTGKELRELRVGANAFGLDFSSDNRLLVVGVAGSPVVLDYATGKEIAHFNAIGVSWTDVKFSGDNHTVFSADFSGEQAQWQVTERTLDELLAWIHANRYVRDFTCEERARFRIPPLCETSAS